MVSLVWLPRIAAALLLASLGVGCDQPTGVVVSVQGVESAERLYLTVGDLASIHASDQPRYIRGMDLGLIDYQPPFPGTFEIFIENPTLLSKPKLALMLDATNGPAASPEIRRDSFEVEPENGALLEVRLDPQPMGAGQWVCWGRARTTADPGVVIQLNGSDTDCDRDGWEFDSDPDDADPLQVGTPAWREEGPFCAIRLGNRILRRDTDCVGSCAPGLCLVNKPRTVCRVPFPTATLTLAQLLVGAARPINPDWMLVKVGPPEAAAYFEPSERSLDEWKATFKIPAGRRDALFQLEDRASSITRLIQIELNDDPEMAECEFQ